MTSLTVSATPNYLATLNSHERDACITFDEGPHIYSINGDSNYMSVTTWNHSHFEHFDADAIITKMMSGKKWTESKYYGMSVEEIKASWEKNRDEAASAGTKMHYDIECYYNKIDVINDSTLLQSYKEFAHFMKFVETFPHLKPYRTEWMVWHEELRFAGSIDMVYEKEDGTLMIYDWKRSKDIKKTPTWGKYAHTECINHLPDTNFWHYSLQLNTYKAILEAKYGKKVTDLYLVCLYPDNPSYQLIKVPNLEAEIKSLFELRRNQLSLTT
jgi:ATP-dependent exoDNAse (exonuclease V) beta subunit